jgi:flagellar basal body P-ring protein FlgI
MLLKALISLRPNDEFTITNDDLSTIVWNNSETVTPSQEEIDAEIARLKAEEDAALAAKEATRNAAVEKLAALGLTADDIAALLN